MPAHLHFDLHEGNGPAMLVVHGIMGGRALWAENIAALRTVCSPVVVEMYGHGRSPTPSDLSAYRPDTYVEEFERIRVSLGIERWWLMGQSLGAALTLRYCLEHPQRGLGHVLTNSASGFADAEWLAKLTANAERDARAIEREGLAGLHDSRMNPAGSHRIVPPVRDALRHDEALMDPLGIANAVRATATTASVRDRVGANTVPSLLVVGTLERGFADSHAYASANMTNLRVETLDAGHSPNAERPEAFNALATAFVRETRPA